MESRLANWHRDFDDSGLNLPPIQNPKVPVMMLPIVLQCLQIVVFCDASFGEKPLEAHLYVFYVSLGLNL